MNKDYLEQLGILRAEVPVGLTRGLQLLAQTGGDLQQVAALLKEEYVEQAVALTGLSEAEVLPYLQRFRFDVSKAIPFLEEDFLLIGKVRHSRSAYQLKRLQHHKEQAIQWIAGMVEKEAGIIRPQHYWLTGSEVGSLPPVQRSVVVVADWLEYYDSEAFASAIHHVTTLFAAALRVLGMASSAAALLLATAIAEEMARQYPDDNIDAHMARSRAQEADEWFRHAESHFEEHRSVIITTLYHYIEQHIDQFP
ncbi:hypothetical protein [Taibaiella koreensis]|uniref:hypothetical protein n=1 Tax=Taibaiella koreensis TaxID=1268548 RepID=UPI000E59D9DF|nr:hypothetical protein [Taibaiella koreensis]